jgi:hypothetical protein
MGWEEPALPSRSQRWIYGWREESTHSWLARVNPA